MKEYQGFPISNFRTGFNESLEPWLLPRDAFQQVINAHLYRGVMEKIEGYTLFASFSYRYTQSLGTANGATKTFTGTLAHLPTTTSFYAYGNIVAGSTAETFSYSMDGTPPTVNLIGSAGGSGTVNTSTGAFSITFNTAPPSGTPIFIIYDGAPGSTTAIMGIKQYYAQNGSQEVLIFDQRRLGKIVALQGDILPLEQGTEYGITEIPHDYYASAIITGDGATAIYTGTLAGAPLVPGSLVWTEYTSTGALGTIVVKDNGAGGLTGTGVTSGSINYLTGAYTITFTANVPSGNYYDSTTGVYGNLFTGSISNFFSLANYQFKAFFTNNVDPIMYYDGTMVHYLNTNLATAVVNSSMGVPTYDISRCLHVFIYQQRLLLIAPTVDTMPELSTIYWSVIANPLDFTNDEFLQASTSQPIRAIGYINTDLVVRFANSERVFRYTGDAFSPFRWDSTNNIWACDSPYGTINYDSWFSSVGRPAIVGSDAVNVKRVDEIIPDFTDPTRLQLQTPVPFMSQTSIIQCYGERFDEFKEGWLCYNSNPQAENTVTPSDNVLAFNYLDSTYAIYSFPFSCLGFGSIFNVQTWGTTTTTWGDMASTWDSYQLQNNALIPLAGDQFDKVYDLSTGNSLGDGTTPVLMSVITKNFNPFIEQGQLCRLGFVDLFVTANQQTILRVQFYLNDQLYIDANGDPAGFYQENILTFDTTDAMSPTTNQTKVWKRIYVGAVGKEHTIRLCQTTEDFADGTLDQPVWIHAIVPYMKPAGRIFN